MDTPPQITWGVKKKETFYNEQCIRCERWFIGYDMMICNEKQEKCCVYCYSGVAKAKGWKL